MSCRDFPTWLNVRRRTEEVNGTFSGQQVRYECASGYEFGDEDTVKRASCSDIDGSWDLEECVGECKKMQHHNAL